MKITAVILVLVLLHINLSCCWFFESPEHPTRREEELENLSDLNQDDLDDVQLFLTYKPYFLEYARQQMLRKKNQPDKRSLPYVLRQRKEK